MTSCQYHFSLFTHYLLQLFKLNQSYVLLTYYIVFYKYRVLCVGVKFDF